MKIGVKKSKQKRIGVHKGMGFHAAAESIAQREGLPMSRASAILAASSRGASAAAKRKNPNLKKV